MRLILKTFVGMALAAVLGIAAGNYLANKVDIQSINFRTTDAVDIFCQGTALPTCHVRFSDSIKDPNEYAELYTLLYKAGRNYTIYFHYAGNGGSFETAKRLSYLIKQSDANTISVVESSVYSAHAILALTAKKIIIHPNVAFMFHRSSLFGTPSEVGCLPYKADKDRSRSAYDKCVKYFEQHKNEDFELMVTFLKPVLTAEELGDVLAGYDVYVDGKILLERLNEKSTNSTKR